MENIVKTKIEETIVDDFINGTDTEHTPSTSANNTDYTLVFNSSRKDFAREVLLTIGDILLSNGSTTLCKILHGEKGCGKSFFLTELLSYITHQWPERVDIIYLAYSDYQGNQLPSHFLIERLGWLDWLKWKCSTIVFSKTVPLILQLAYLYKQAHRLVVFVFDDATTIHPQRTPNGAAILSEINQIIELEGMGIYCIISHSTEEAGRITQKEEECNYYKARKNFNHFKLKEHWIYPLVQFHEFTKFVNLTLTSLTSANHARRRGDIICYSMLQFQEPKELSTLLYYSKGNPRAIIDYLYHRTIRGGTNYQVTPNLPITHQSFLKSLAAQISKSQKCLDNTHSTLTTAAATTIFSLILPQLLLPLSKQRTILGAILDSWVRFIPLNEFRDCNDLSISVMYDLLRYGEIFVDVSHTPPLVAFSCHAAYLTQTVTDSIL